MARIMELIVGGAAGTLARYALGGLVYRVAGPRFPYGTMAVNLAGCFLIGVLSTMAEEKFLLGSSVRTTLMIGFCGAFTTFSTFIFETSNLARDGEMFPALANILVSVAAGFILFRLGVLAARAA